LGSFIFHFLTSAIADLEFFYRTHLFTLHSGARLEFQISHNCKAFVMSALHTHYTRYMDKFDDYGLAYHPSEQTL